ncbi:MAG: HPF/RaiA family ribosome-associated protein, partial [Clostridia bacterium]
TDVALFEEKIGERVEITIHRGGTIFRAEETGKDYICALDNAMDVLERQIRRNRTRLEKKKQIPKSIVYDVEPIDNDDTEDELIISKTKHFDILPMTTEEAILQMNLLSHTFFLFQNVKTGALNVVYKRKKNNYGIIEPND